VPSDAPSRLQCADLGRPLGETRSGMASTRSAPHPGHLKVTIRLDSWQRGSHPATSEPATSWKWAALEIKTHLPKLSPRTNELSAERESVRSAIGLRSAAREPCGYGASPSRTIAVPTFLVALELRLSYLAQYANQDAGEQMVQSDAVRRSGTWSLGRRIAGGRLGRSSRRVGYVAGT